MIFAILLLTPVTYIVTTMQGMHGARRWVMAPAYAASGVVVAFLFIGGLQWLASRVMMSFMQPGGRSRESDSNSRAESLAAVGMFDDASAEFEASRARRGESIASLRAEAEIHASAAGDPKRAEELYLRIRRSPLATRNDELYASHRLIDLYLGLLDDPGRVMVELRRMAERFPDTIDGQGALSELNRRRAEEAAA
jgi:hypothetical protein